MSRFDYPVYKEPRSVRVSIGSLAFLAAVLFGVAFAVPQVHQSLVMQPFPIQMTWVELASKGLADNSYVELVDVAASADTEHQVLLESLRAGIDPEATSQERAEKLRAHFDSFDAKQLVQLTQPFVLIPRGAVPTGEPLVAISRFDSNLDRAKQQLQESGSVSGYIRPASDMSWLQKLNDQAGLGLPVELFQHRASYVLSPVESIPERGTAVFTCAATWLVATVALVWAASGGPSLLMSILIPIPAMISLLGYPLRYGRVTTMTRSLYMSFGVAAVVTGIWLALIRGGLGTPTGDLVMCGAAFVLVVMGSAAMLGARLSVPAPKPVTDYPQVSYMEPDTEFRFERFSRTTYLESSVGRTNKYRDPRLSDASDQTIPEVVFEQVRALEPYSFRNAKNIYVHLDERKQLACLTLGCHQMVLSEIMQSGNTALVRFTSVMSDGLVVMTLGASTPRVSSLRVGANGVYARSKSDDAVEALSEHLNRVASIAEERVTQLAAIDEYERIDVFLLGRRVLVDIQNEYMEEAMFVAGAKYGRFSFPGAPVESLIGA